MPQQEDHNSSHAAVADFFTRYSTEMCVFTEVRSASNPQFRTGPHFKTCGKFCDYFDTVLCFPSSVRLSAVGRQAFPLFGVNTWNVFLLPHVTSAPSLVVFTQATS